MSLHFCSSTSNRRRAVGEREWTPIDNHMKTEAHEQNSCLVTTFACLIIVGFIYRGPIFALLRVLIKTNRELRCRLLSTTFHYEMWSFRFIKRYGNKIGRTHPAFLRIFGHQKRCRVAASVLCTPECPNCRFWSLTIDVSTDDGTKNQSGALSPYFKTKFSATIRKCGPGSIIHDIYTIMIPFQGLLAWLTRWFDGWKLSQLLLIPPIGLTMTFITYLAMMSKLVVQ